jgi:hypothetical protein
MARCSQIVRFSLIAFVLAWAPPQAIGQEAGARALADRIDRALEAVWKSEGIQPAEPATDAEFFRRLSLDLTGCIPPAADVRAFLKDNDPDKRRKATDRLLSSPRFIHHQTNLWRDRLLPAANGPQVERWRLELEAWLREQFRKHVPYDRMVRELLTTSVRVTPETPNGRPDRPGEPTPLPFYRAAEFKADLLGAGIARVFLGINLECAQCHDHPFAPWTKRNYAEFAANFASVQPTRWQSGRVIAVVEDSNRRTFALPGDDAIPARYLDGSEPRWQERAASRALLANWMVTSENPYFTRHAVNNLWEQLFGAPLVEEEGSPFKELRDDLARSFAAEGFDTNLLLRALTASHAYQASSAVRAESSRQTLLFARMRVRGLSGEQLLDSIARAAGLTDTVEAGFRADFLSRFNQPGEKSAQRQTSILQTLALLNGSFLATATSAEHGPLLAGIAEAPWLDTSGKIDALYLAALGRFPRDSERARYLAAIKDDKEGGRQALADVFWALLNSSEFLFNH